MANEDPRYLDQVRLLRCRLYYDDPCQGGVEAHHAGERGFGQRAHDHTAIPMCRFHHQAFHDCNPPFKGWTKPNRRLWADRQIAMTKHRVRMARKALDEFKI